MERITDKLFMFELNLSNGDVARLTICPSFYSGERTLGAAEVVTFDKGLVAGLFELKTLKTLDYTDSEASIPYGLSAGAELVLSFDYSTAIKLISQDDNELFTLVESFLDNGTTVPIELSGLYKGQKLPTLLQLELLKYPYTDTPMQDKYIQNTYALKKSVGAIESAGTSDFIFQLLPAYALNVLNFRTAWTLANALGFNNEYMQERPFCIQEKNREAGVSSVGASRVTWSTIPFTVTKVPFDYPRKIRNNVKPDFSDLSRNIIYSDWNNMIYGHAIINWTGSFYYLPVSFVFDCFFWFAEIYMEHIGEIFRATSKIDMYGWSPFRRLFSKQQTDGRGGCGSAYDLSVDELCYCVAASQIVSVDVEGTPDFMHVPRFGIIPKFNTKNGHSSEGLLPSDEIMGEQHTSNMSSVWPILDFDNVLEFLIATCKQLAVQAVMVDLFGMTAVGSISEWAEDRANTGTFDLDVAATKYTASIGENYKPIQFSYAGFSKSNGDLEFQIFGDNGASPYNIDVYTNNVPKKQLEIPRGVWNMAKTRWVNSKFESELLYDMPPSYCLPFGWVGGTGDHAREYNDWCVYGLGSAWIGADLHLEPVFTDLFLLDAKFDLDIYENGMRVSNLISMDGVDASASGLGVTLQDAYNKENNHKEMAWGSSILENRSFKIDPSNNSWHIMASADLCTTERIDAVSRQFLQKLSLVQNDGLSRYISQFFEKWTKNSVQLEVATSTDRSDTLAIMGGLYSLFEVALFYPHMLVQQITSTTTDFFAYSDIFSGLFFPVKVELDFQSSILTINYSKWSNEN